MAILFGAIDRVALALHRLGALLLVLMMATVVFDVVTRALFSMSAGRLDLTFLGGIELVSYGLLCCVLFCLPHCVDKGQVVVDLFSQNISERTERRVTGLYTLGFAALGLAMSWRFLHAFQQALLTQETTQDLLIPLAYFYLTACLATLLLGVRSLRVAVAGLCVPGERSACHRQGSGARPVVKGEAI